MRVGYNPNKDRAQQPIDFFHQVIIPVYIPNKEGYFKDSFQILKYCLESLLRTSHSKTFITLVNNGSGADVVDYLAELHRKGTIQEIIHTDNIGKLNAVLKGISGHDFSFVTVADCDVLFLNNWQNETYKVFEKFPKTGAVCPTPSSKSLKNFTANIWFDLFFSKSLYFSKVKNPQALEMFAKSIGNNEMYNDIHLSKYLTVINKNFKAVVGAGHFVTTYRKEVFEENNLKYSHFMLGGGSETDILDYPVVKKGMWRLSTADNFAYHLGNVEESWMKTTLETIQPDETDCLESNFLRPIQSSRISFLLKYQLFSRIILQKRIWRFALKLKGLSNEEVKKYSL
ncbi:glycosyltransferase family A protein [Flavobacterium ustbae]|uniref:glycosyltransferase family A protein n=1 Tax=Flavobacterium ustbae TaxID=2488790 RepID=UPI000F76F8FD|nr:glycosyltransferase family A protein [Flavobacterium ustbae]